MWAKLANIKKHSQSSLSSLPAPPTPTLVLDQPDDADFPHIIIVSPGGVPFSSRSWVMQRVPVRCWKVTFQVSLMDQGLPFWASCLYTPNVEKQ